MPRYKPSDQNGLLLPVILSEQIQRGSFEFALDHLVEHELDLSDACLVRPHTNPLSRPGKASTTIGLTQRTAGAY